MHDLALPSSGPASGTEDACFFGLSLCSGAGGKDRGYHGPDFWKCWTDSVAAKSPETIGSACGSVTSTCCTEAVGAPAVALIIARRAKAVSPIRGAIATAGGAKTVGSPAIAVVVTSGSEAVCSIGRAVAAT